MVPYICRDCKQKNILFNYELSNPKCISCGSSNLDMGKISYGRYCPPGCEFIHD